jgi:hypothetical protein
MENPARGMDRGDWWEPWRYFFSVFLACSPSQRSSSSSRLIFIEAR